MNKVVTSREDILAAARSLSRSGNLADLSMRTVAKACGIAVGSVYYYFPSKDELVAALVEDIWRSILASPGQGGAETGFADSVAALYARIRRGSADFPSFFSLHAASFGRLDKRSGRQLMGRQLEGIKAELLAALAADGTVAPEVFDQSLSREGLVSFVFSAMLSALGSGEEDCGTLRRLLSLALRRG